MRGYLAEGYRWLDASLAAAPEHTAVRARALLAACLVGLRRGVHERLHEFGAESVAIFGELDDHAGMFDAVEVSAAYRTIVSGEKDIEVLVSEYGTLVVDDLPTARPPAWAAHTRGIAAWLRREYPRARQQLEAALERAGELVAEPRPALWPISYGLISVESEVGYPLLLHEDTVLVGRRVGGEAATAYILVNLATVDRAEGDLTHAGELIEESLSRFRRLADRQGAGGPGGDRDRRGAGLRLCKVAAKRRAVASLSVVETASQPSNGEGERAWQLEECLERQR